MIYDITRKIALNTAVWPGDATFQYTHVLDKREGASVNLTTITLSPHTATHADAYYHYAVGGSHPADMPLDAYMGTVHVVSVEKQEGALYPADFPALHALEHIERLLVHSIVSDLPDTTFPTTFPYLSVELIEWLAERRCRLIGLDSPSVDHFESQSLPCHQALLKNNMVNLEFVQLRDVPNGIYELIALPLKIEGVCGSPVRAVLRSFT